MPLRTKQIINHMSNRFKSISQRYLRKLRFFVGEEKKKQVLNLLKINIEYKIVT